MRIARLSAHLVGVTARTNWLHVTLVDEDDVRGVGEGTLDAHERQVSDFANGFASRLVDRDIVRISDICSELGLEGVPGGLAHAAAASAVEQALWDIWARRHQMPVFALFGTTQPAAVPLYANINRCLPQDRSPQAFADAALRARSAGFKAIKCAPFDEVRRGQLEDRSTRVLVDAGLSRLAAVRDAIGDDVGLMVDCHYRFTGRSAVAVLKELELFNPMWIEAPVAEHRIEEWREVRAGTDVRLAGGEMMTGIGAFRRFMEWSGVDVVMPDVKYVGGLTGLSQIAHIAHSRGVLVAPHNPSGPIATLATAHIAASLPNFLTLEFAFGECEWRSALVGGAEVIVDGELHLASNAGLGIELDEGIMESHPGRAVVPLDTRLYG